ncbi:MAG TPA: ribbon-helix-helix protein, CopG family [Acidimicrobiales bacterium]|nr:ribbon-helix-helix protein, CopG family [Acidimicrobiales bacterium]
MRTTVSLDDDVAAAVQRLRHDRKLGVSEAVNDLVRRGLRGDEERRPVQLETVRLDLRFDVSNVAEALEIAEGPDRP